MFHHPANPTLLLLLLSASSLVASIPVGGDLSTVRADTGATGSIENHVGKILELVFKSDEDETKKNMIKEEFEGLLFSSDSAKKFSLHLKTYRDKLNSITEKTKKTIEREWKQSECQSFKEVERIADLVIEQGKDLSEAVKEAPLQILLEAAVTQNTPLVVETILRFPPDGFSQDKVVRMALEAAITQDKLPVVQTILDVPPDGLSSVKVVAMALETAVTQNQILVIEAIMLYPPYELSLKEVFLMALEMAILQDKVDMVETLVFRYKPVDVWDEEMIDLAFDLAKKKFESFAHFQDEVLRCVLKKTAAAVRIADFRHRALSKIQPSTTPNDKNTFIFKLRTIMAEMFGFKV